MWRTGDDLSYKMSLQSKKEELKSFIKNLPNPLNKEKFNLLKKGIWDNPKTQVYINEKKDFTFLFPQKKINYKKYTPRKKKIGLQDYKRILQKEENNRRYKKICKYFMYCKNLLEIGSGEGKFLKLINSKERLSLFSLEKDEAANLSYRNLKWLTNFNDFKQVKEEFDIICFFHVFEHIYEPHQFLQQVKRIMKKNGKVILEVPSLDDPILSLYRIKEYVDFFFQAQHPFTYSRDSLMRVMRKYFRVEDVIPFQRYGLDNHLSWLMNKKPGGSKVLNNLFEISNKDYIKDLENSKKTDAVILVLKNR